jgi:hypothetical protein
MNIPYLCTSVAQAIHKAPIPTMDSPDISFVLQLQLLNGANNIRYN